MTVTHYNYNPEPQFNEGYRKLRDFLIRLDNHNFHFGRWDWMITHGYLDKSGLPRIRMWEEDGIVVAAATYDCFLGEAFLIMDQASGRNAASLCAAGLCKGREMQGAHCRRRPCPTGYRRSVRLFSHTG